MLYDETKDHCPVCIYLRSTKLKFHSPLEPYWWVVAFHSLLIRAACRRNQGE